jgi:hypothetical protein
MKPLMFLALGLLALLPAGSPAAPARELNASEAREIARDAYVYGFPMVDNYRVLDAYAVDQANIAT